MECVISACYEPCKYWHKGDHRTILIDFDAVRLFGNPTYNIVSPMRRELNSKDRKAVKEYIEERYKYLVDHKFGERLTKVQSRWDANDTEGLDRDYQRVCKYGGKCQKKPNIAFVKKIAASQAEK